MPEVISAPAMPQCGFRGPPWGISGGITADDVGLNAAARRFRTMKVLGKESRIFPFWKNRAYPSSERDRTFPLASPDIFSLGLLAGFGVYCLILRTVLLH